MLAQAVREAWRKFATGIFLIWYPIKSRAEADGFTGEILAAGMEKLLAIEVAVPAPEGKLGRAGLLAINPPYGFEAAMRACAAMIAPRLGAGIELRWLAGGE